MASLILTLDSGTSSVRAMLFAAGGDMMGRPLPDSETQIKYSVRTTPDGGVELDPAMLLDNTMKVVDGVLAKVPRGDTVVAVAMDTLWHGALGVDADGEAITPLYLYSDTRAAGAAAHLRAVLDPRAVHERTGCVLHPSYWPARLLWLRDAQPDVCRRVARWHSFGEYLYLRLFGHTVVSYSMASGTGLLDVHKLAWDPQVLQAIALDQATLAPLGDRDTRFGPVEGEWAHRWPLLKDAPWFPALGDGACSNIGSGCATPARINLTVGTTGALRVVPDTPDAAVHAGLFCYRVDKSRPLIGGATSEGGNLFAWMRIVADVLNRPVIALDEQESTSRGAALLALESLGLLKSAASAPAAFGATYAPDPARHARYVQAIARQSHFYDLLVAPEQQA